MKKAIRFSSPALICAVVIYLVSWFVTCEPDFTKWSEDGRFVIALLWVVISVFATAGNETLRDF